MKKMYDNVNHFSTDEKTLVLPDVASSSLAHIPAAQTITPDYFVQHYHEFLPRYIANGNPSSNTLKTYCSWIDHFICWCLDNHLHPLAVNDYQMRLFREYLIQENYQPATNHTVFMSIRSFFSAAQQLGLISVNPCQDVSIASTTSHNLLNFYSQEQMVEICEFFDQEPDQFIRTRNILILYLMGVEGLRNIEVHRLCREDIRWDIKVIMIRGKGAAGRLDPIYPCSETFDILKAYIDAIRTDKPIKKEGSLTPLILSDSHNNELGRISRNGLRYIMNKALKITGLKQQGQTCHIFRHSCGTNLYQQTKDLRVVQDTLRHRDPKITARYAHVNQQLNNRVTSGLSLRRREEQND